MRIQLLFLVAGILAASCSCDPPNQTCLKGKSVVSSCCTGTTVIELTGGVQLGDTISINGVQYYNAIQVNGKIADDEEIFFKIRTYDPDKDTLPIECNCVAAEFWVGLPTYMITEWYDESCRKLSDF